MRVQTLIALVLIVGVCPAANAQQFGRTKGNFGVSPTGSANYSIPITVPPGVANLQPSLALSYNSRSGDGLLGVGWDLVGLSSITRCNLTNAQDTASGTPQLTSGDRFCLDGNRLRATSGTYGGSGTTYQTEIANFANITSNGTTGSGPASFTVQAKNGLTYYYGNTTDSAVLAQGSTSVLTWALNAVHDRNGNAMTFTYTDDTTNGSYRIASIQYTYTGNSTSNNGYSITFTYQSRPSSDQPWSYTVGGLNTQLNYLSSITVYSGTTMVHGYALTYATAPTTSRLRISSIQECASAFTSDCFPASTVSYQNGATGWAAEVANSGNVTNMSYALPIDVNGDGIDDLVYPDPTSGHWYYELGTTSGAYSGPYDTGISSTNYQSALAIDFYSNGRKDVMFPNSSGNWRVMQFVSAGAAFSYVDTSTSAAGVVPGSAMVGDVDGDGREDLIYAVSGGPLYSTADFIYYRLNTGGAFSTTQGTLASFPNGASCDPCTKLAGTDPFGNPIYRYRSHTRTLDFNGDGKADVMVGVNVCSANTPGMCGRSVQPVFYWQLFVSQPNGTYAEQDAVGYTSAGLAAPPPLAADFNGDGCTDIAFPSSSNTWWVRYGTCGRSGAVNILSAPVSTAIAYTSSSLALAIDWDGDGRADIIQPGTTDWMVTRSTGNNLSALVDTGIPTEGATVVQVADVNGDGQRDLLYMVSNALKTRIHSGSLPDLATAFTDAYGVTYSPTYVPLSNSTVYTKGSSQTYPQEDYEGPLYVVPSFTASDGVGGTYSISYTYSSAVINLQGRGFEGFAEITKNDSRNGLNDFVSYSTVFPTTGMVSLKKLTQPTTTKLIRVVTPVPTSLTLDGTSNNERYFPYNSTVTTQSYEVGGAEDATLITTSLTNNGTPDSYGNFTNVETTLTDNDPNSPYYNEQWTSTTANTIAPQTSTWCLSLPTQITVTNTAPGVSAITRTTRYTPDYTYCRETQQVVEPSSATYKVTTAYSFDSFGNLNGQTVTGIGMAARTSSAYWGTSGQFPAQVTNALSQTSNLSFDPLKGVLVSQQDPNGVTTSWQYDTFGRKTKETRPDGTYTTWAYNNCSSAGCVNANNQMTIVQTAFNSAAGIIRTDNKYLDTFDRALVMSGQMINGAYDRNEIQYDNLGRVHLQGMPCTFVACTQYWVTNSYDIVNRLIQSQRPISSSNSTAQTTSYAYQGRTETVTDPQGKVTTTITQVTGKLGRSIDNNGYYVNFNRDAFGSRYSTTDSLSNTLSTATYQYGIAPFMVSSTDMDLGSRSYTIDALGEMTGYSDAKGQNFSTIYDALSRPTSRTEPDLTTTWTWGTTAASYNIGKLQSISSVATAGTYSESYTYDSAGRLSNKTLVIPSDATRAFDYSYQNTGLLDTVTFPVSYPSTYRLAVRYTYQYGIPLKIYDGNATSTNWWTANAMNPRGQVTQETTEDAAGDPQIVSSRVFDAVTGWLSSTQTGVSGGAALQNESYVYDLVGNVTQRQNGNLGLTENFYYDNLYRLDHSVLGSSTNLQMGYDAMGDITSRSDIAGGASWTYDPTHKHQVTQAGSSSYTYAYDANGNATSRNGSIIGWTSYNYPNGVGTSTESATFDYGPNRQRWRMIYTGPSGTETTYYASPLFEAVYTSSGTDYRHYIYAAGRPVVVVSRTTAGAVNVRSLLTDHQGSISSIVTDSSGSSFVSESFTAYGNRREASTWSGAPTSGELVSMNGVTRQGYTFQTVLGSMGLNHMNGRIVDAVTGRFLSADPHGIQTRNTQSFNRYSYAGNNPLTMTDPSGFTNCNTKGNALSSNCVTYESRDTVALEDFGESALGPSIMGVNVDNADFSGGTTLVQMASLQNNYTIGADGNLAPAPGNKLGASAGASAPAGGSAPASNGDSPSYQSGPKPTLSGGSITVEMPDGTTITTNFDPSPDFRQSYADLNPQSVAAGYACPGCDNRRALSPGQYDFGPLGRALKPYNPGEAAAVVGLGAPIIAGAYSTAAAWWAANGSAALLSAALRGMSTVLLESAEDNELINAAGRTYYELQNAAARGFEALENALEGASEAPTEWPPPNF